MKVYAVVDKTAGLFNLVDRFVYETKEQVEKRLKEMEESYKQFYKKEPSREWYQKYGWTQLELIGDYD